MSERKVRFGFIGTGQLGQFLDGGPYNGVAWWQGKAIQKVPGLEIVAGSSRTRANVEAFCRDFKAKHVFTDYRDMLACPDVDAVSICTPSGTHSDIIIAAAQAGKHVIVEKPLDVRLEKIDAAVAACRKAGVKLQVAFGRRFQSGVRPLKQAIEEGKIGKMVLVHAHCRRERGMEYFRESSWRGTRWGDGGGVLMNQGSHIIDFMLYLCGDVESLRAYTAELNHPGIEVEDTASVLLRFKNGALGAITATTSACPDLFDGVSINGTRAAITLGKPGPDCWRGQEPPPPGLDEKLPFTGHAGVFADMVGAIQQDRDPLCTGEEGRRAVELILAAYESVRRGTEVKLPLG
jgi:predicted dehydrogenase